MIGCCSGLVGQADRVDLEALVRLAWLVRVIQEFPAVLRPAVPVAQAQEAVARLEVASVEAVSAEDGSAGAAAVFRAEDEADAEGSAATPIRSEMHAAIAAASTTATSR